MVMHCVVFMTSGRRCDPVEQVPKPCGVFVMHQSMMILSNKALYFGLCSFKCMHVATPFPFHVISLLCYYILFDFI